MTANPLDAVTSNPPQGRILALDCATRLGWAYFDGGSVTHGVVQLIPEKCHDRGLRIINFYSWLDANWRGKVDFVGFEDVGGVRFAALFRISSELVGLVHLWAEQQQVPYSGFSPCEIKKHATGKGTADKAAMIRAAQAFSPSITDDNEADALLILRYVQENVAGLNAAGDEAEATA